MTLRFCNEFHHACFQVREPSTAIHCLCLRKKFIWNMTSMLCRFQPATLRLVTGFHNNQQVNNIKQTNNFKDTCTFICLRRVISGDSMKLMTRDIFGASDFSFTAFDRTSMVFTVLPSPPTIPPRPSTRNPTLSSLYIHSGFFSFQFAGACRQKFERHFGGEVWERDVGCVQRKDWSRFELKVIH